MSESNPARPSADHAAAAPRWAMARALMGGTSAMRAAGEAYLPRYEAEDPASYRTRLARAVLLPAFEEAVREIAGRVFARPVTLGEDVPPRLRAWLEDADLLGNALHGVAGRWFTEALITGIAWLQVDMPDAKTPEARRRPYLVPLAAEDVVAAYADGGDGAGDGTWRLSHARVRHGTIRRDGFGERRMDMVHVLEPGRHEVWTRSDSGWQCTAEGRTGLNAVPLVPLRLGPPLGPFAARPPLEGLAHLNIAHWQSASDQRNILTLGRFAMLALSGPAPEGPEGESLAVGPKTFLQTPDPSARWYYVEPAGTAIAAGERDLERLEAQMDRLALEPLVSRPGTVTATAAAIASSRAHSAVQSWAQSLRDGLEQALLLMARWVGEPQGGSVHVNTDFADPRASTDLDALEAARERGDLSRATLLGELKRRGVLSWSFDPDADARHLATEAAGSLPVSPEDPEELS